MLFGVAALSAQQAAAPQAAARPTIVVVAGTAVSVLSHSSGWVYVDARRGSNRVAGWYAPAAIETWAADAERVLTDSENAQGVRMVGHASGTASSERVEHKTGLLMSADAGGVVLDRTEQNGSATHGLFLADKESMHRMYLPLDAANARAFVTALRDAATSSRQLAAAKAAAQQAAQQAASTPVVAEKARAGGM